MRHLIVLVSASVLVVSCNHRTPVVPETSDPLRALYGPWFDFVLELPPDSNGTLKGMIFHGPGRQSGLKVRLEPQTHTLEGTLSGSGVSYKFELSSSEGSLVPGSFKALSGPVERLARCEVVFAKRTTSPDPFPIRVQFMVQDSISGDCHRE
jgi:hypothetical protein